MIRANGVETTMQFPAMDAFIDIFLAIGEYITTEARVLNTFGKIGALRLRAQGPGTMNAGYTWEVVEKPAQAHVLAREEMLYRTEMCGVPGAGTTVEQVRSLKAYYDAVFA